MADTPQPTSAVLRRRRSQQASRLKPACGEAGVAWDLPVVGLIAVYLGVMVVIALLLPGSRLVRLFEDDAFFYIKVAQNIRAGLGSTFDGINQTNGYHPLWLWVLVAAAFVHPLRGFDALRPLLVLHAVLIGSATLFAASVLRAARASWIWTMAGAVAIIGLEGFTNFGMESALALALAWALLFVLVQYMSRPLPEQRLAVLAALLSFLLPLARTDAVLLPVLVGLTLASVLAFGQKRRTAALGLMLVTVLPSLCSFGGFAALNLVQSGHLGTTASSLKIHWPGEFATHWWRNNPMGGPQLRLAALMLAAAASTLFLLPAALRQGRASSESGAVAAVLLGAGFSVLVHMAVLLMLSAIRPPTWYFPTDTTIALVSIALIATRQLQRAEGRLPAASSLAGAIALCVAAVVAGWYVPHRIAGSEGDAGVAVAGWLRQNSATSDVVFMVDGAGLVGYASERPVIDGDGLANSWEYQDYVRSGRLLRYVADKHVSWIVASDPEQDGRVAVQVPLWTGASTLLGTVPTGDLLYSRGRYSIFRAAELEPAATIGSDLRWLSESGKRRQ